MGLYYKNESSKPADVRKVRSKKKVHKRKKRHNAVQMWKLYGIMGILCVLMAVGGVAFFVNQEADAASLQEVNWTDIQGEQNHDKELPFYRKNRDKEVTPSDLGMKLYKEGDKYVTYISTAEQLKYAASGLMHSYTYVERWEIPGSNAGSGVSEYLEFKYECVKKENVAIIFRLASDISYTVVSSSDFNYAVAKKYDDGSDSWDSEYFACESGSVFNGDVFDGQGHTITLAMNISNQLDAFIWEDITVSDDRVLNSGALFARVENTTIKNLNLHISGEYFKTDSGRLYCQAEAASGGALAGGIGLLCGGADNSVFQDINITADDDVIVRARIVGGGKAFDSYYQVGFGTVVGCIGKYVKINRCDTNINVQLDSNEDFYSQAKKNTWFAGSAVAGIAIGYGNEINACINRFETPEGTVRYVWEKDKSGNTDEKSVTYVVIHGDLLGLAGVMDQNPEKRAGFTDKIVDLNDCVIYSRKDRAVGGVKRPIGNDGSDFLADIKNIRVIDDTKLAEDAYPWATLWLNLEKRADNTSAISLNYYSNTYNAEVVYKDRPAVGSQDIDGTTKNWFYDSRYFLHLLKDSYQISAAEDGTSCDITFAPPELPDPNGTENIIRVQANLQKWNDESNFAKNSKAEIYITTGEGVDPKTTNLASAVLFGKNASGGDAVLIVPDDNCPKYADDPTVVNARIKVTLNGNDDNPENDIVFWSGLATRTYTEIDVMIDKPVLKLKKETEEEFAEHMTSMAYAIGTTKWTLTIPEGKDFKIKLYYGPKSGLQISDPSGADYIDPVSITIPYEKAVEMTLSQDMIRQDDSNLIYLYVLAEAEKDGVVKQKLYEYDLITFIKDTLLRAIPENNSRIPNGSTVQIQVGNGKEAEYPYKELRVLVSDKKMTKLPVTLQGMTGVVTYKDWYGSGTKEDPWYLEASQKLSGTVGSKYYVYVEPVTNTEQKHPDGTVLSDSAIPYYQRYAGFVQEYVYTIMDSAAAPALSPTTVKTTGSGEPTAIAVDSKIYITGKTNTDLILYNLTGDPIVPELITDKEKIKILDARTDVETIGAITYFEDTQAEKLYVKCNNAWYEMDDVDADNSDTEDDSLRVYKDGELYFDLSHENQNAYVSAIVFADGYGPSSNDIYVYYVDEQGAVAVPIALLEPGSNISMNRVLHFSSESGTVIFYTTDGREPQVQIQDDGSIKVQGNTRLYQVESGIAITESDGFAYGSTATIKMLACPVLDETLTESELFFNNKKKVSPAVTFTYEIAQQNQVEAPTAYPETPGADPYVVKKGDKIVLNCATSEAEIFYTTDGTVPDKNSEKYTNVITVDGIYGGYFTVKAFACKADMKDSEVATFTFKIADQEVVGSVTATPGTSNTVIAGDKIILSATTPDAQIFYTTDGTVPEVTMSVSGNSISYICAGTTKQYDPSKPVSVAEGSGYFIVKAIAVKPDMTDSDVAEFVYTYADEVGAPYGNPSSGTVKKDTEVLLLSATKDARIYYEIAYGETPKDPTLSSPVFSDKAPIVITKDTVIKAFAVYDRESSQIVTLKYTLAEQMAKPSVSTSSGSIVPSGTKITFRVADGTVYYTTDGSDPSDDKNALVNSGSSMVITGNPGDTVKVNVCTKKTGASDSEVMTLTYQISQYVGGVTADVESGSVVSKGDKVHLTTDVTGGTIYFTTASGSPITEGIAGNNVLITGEPGSTVLLKAVAVAPGTEMTGSYANFQYKLMEQLAAPNGSVMSGTVMTEATNLVLKANKGKIYYTIDGSDPDKNSYVYEYPIVIYKDMVVKAIAVEENYENSDISIFSYTFAEKVSGLTASKDSGNLQAGDVIWLTADQAEADIYYTTDGSNPDPKAPEGTFRYDPVDGIRINRNVSIKAIAAMKGMQNSSVLELSYTVDNVPAQEEKQAQKEALENSGPTELNTEQLEERRPGVSDNAVPGSIVLRDINNGARLKGSSERLSDKMSLGTKEIAISKDAQKSVKNLLGDEYEFLNNYEVTLYLNGKRIQPEGEVEIALPLPKGYENADVSIIYSNEKGQIQVIETRRENGYAYANVTHLKNFGVVGADVGKNSSRNMDLILLLTACAALLTGFGAVMIFRTKKQEVS